MTDDLSRIKIDVEPMRLRIDSEPYVLFLGRQYVPVINVTELKRNNGGFLIIAPVSISVVLHQWAEDGGQLQGIEFWINKTGNEKFSTYELQMS